MKVHARKEILSFSSRTMEQFESSIEIYRTNREIFNASVPVSRVQSSPSESRYFVHGARSTFALSSPPPPLFLP